MENLTPGGGIDLKGVLHINKETNAFLSRSQLAVGDVLVSIAGTIGRSAVVSHEHVPANCNQAIALVRMDQSKAVPSFIRCFLASDRGQQALLADAVQLAQANLSLGQIAKTWVPLPPIPEQRHITAVLDTVNEAIAKAEAVIAKLQQVRAGLLHDLLTHGLDEHGQLHDPIVHPEHFQDSSLGRIPYTWRVAQLREVADIASGVTLGRNLNGAGILELPYLRVANVQDGYLDLADVKTIKIFPGELDRFRLRRGDVLMNEGGDYDKLGRGTVWEDQIPVCLHQNHVFRVRCRPDVLNYYFLAAVSGSEIGKRYFLRSSKQSTNLASINSTQLNAFEIPLPSLAEQEAIVKILKAQDDQLTAETRGLVKLHALKSGLMADLLTGCIRVPESVSAVENQP